MPCWEVMLGQNHDVWKNTNTWCLTSGQKNALLLYKNKKQIQIQITVFSFAPFIHADNILNVSETVGL